MLLRFLHRHGFGVQSPWAYSLVRDVLFESLRYYSYDDIRRRHSALARSRRQQKLDRQLFRIVNHFQPEIVLISGDADAETLDFIVAANSRIKLTKLTENIDEMPTFCDFSAPKLVYLAPKASGQTIYAQLRKKMIAKSPENAQSDPQNKFVIVVDDIRRTQKNLWQTLLSDPLATATFDMSSRGLAFFDKKRIKENYKL